MYQNKLITIITLAKLIIENYNYRNLKLEMDVFVGKCVGVNGANESIEILACMILNISKLPCIVSNLNFINFKFKTPINEHTINLTKYI